MRARVKARSATRILGGEHPVYAEYREVVKFWILQILVPMGGHKALLIPELCRDDEVMGELGLGHLVENDNYEMAAARKGLFDLYALVMDKPRPLIPATTRLARNIRWLGKVVGLNKTEQYLLHFRIIASRHLALRACLDDMGKAFDQIRLAAVLSKILGIQQAKLEKALELGSKLTATGLLGQALGLAGVMEKIFFPTGLVDRLFSAHKDHYEIFNESFRQVGKARLNAKDYPHLSEDICMIQHFLQESLDGQRSGVNILIYGTPGSGKTEFVKMVAHQMGRPLYEVSTANCVDGPIKKGERFRSFTLSQAILSSNEDHPLLMFDEVEDVFNNDPVSPGVAGNHSGMKGWINKLLEGNRVPTFWITNNVSGMDTAYIRRFDYVLELNAPPRSVRKNIIDKYTDGVELSSSWKAKIAEFEHLNPAFVEQAARVVEVVSRRNPDISTEKAMERVLGNTLEALGLPRSEVSGSDQFLSYRLDVLNTDCYIAEVCDGLKKWGEGRMCLYGPPGTGKTAFGQYLAEWLDRPLMVRKASNIFSKWLGETERNMARMFREAASENAVLLLDEADSFLQSRDVAQRGWEISQVNEMLTQMESFKGIFIASTNLMDKVDAAALRRFDLKVKFDYLKADQAWQMFIDIAAKFGLEVSSGDRIGIAKLNLLTPGDFANVARQAKLRRILSTADLLHRLAAECEMKPAAAKRAIGFTT